MASTVNSARRQADRQRRRGRGAHDPRRGGCNLFFAGYKLKNGALRFDAVASTKKYCEATMQVEDAFFKALGAVTKLSAVDDILKMGSKNGKTELTFVRAQPD